MDTLGYIIAISAIGLTALGYALYRVVLAVGAVLAWILLGLWAYNQSTALWDLYYGLFWLSLGVGLAIIVDTIWLLIQEQSQSNREERQADLDEKRDEREETARDRTESGSEHPIDKIRREHGLPPSEARARRKENRRFRAWR